MKKRGLPSQAILFENNYEKTNYTAAVNKSFKLTPSKK